MASLLPADETTRFNLPGNRAAGFRSPPLRFGRSPGASKLHRVCQFFSDATCFQVSKQRQLRGCMMLGVLRDLLNLFRRRSFVRFSTVSRQIYLLCFTCFFLVFVSLNAIEANVVVWPVPSWSQGWQGLGVCMRLYFRQHQGATGTKSTYLGTQRNRHYWLVNDDVCLVSEGLTVYTV